MGKKGTADNGKREVLKRNFYWGSVTVKPRGKFFYCKIRIDDLSILKKRVEVCENSSMKFLIFKYAGEFDNRSSVTIDFERRKYKTNKRGDVLYNSHEITFAKKGIKGKLILRPAFYIPDSYLSEEDKARKYWNANKIVKLYRKEEMDDKKEAKYRLKSAMRRPIYKNTKVCGGGMMT